MPTVIPPTERGDAANGGFPEPLAGGSVRVVRAEHDACGCETRVRLPGSMPTSAVRRVVCQGCANSFEAAIVEEIALLEAALAAFPRGTLRRLRSKLRRPRLHAPMRRLKLRKAKLRLPKPHLPRIHLSKLRRPKLRVPKLRLSRLRRPKLRVWKLRLSKLHPRKLHPPQLCALRTLPAWARDHESRGRRHLTLAVGAIAVLGAMVVIQGSESDPPPRASTAAASPVTDAAKPERGGKAAAGRSADLVRESSFSLALPPHWKQTGTAGGATFAAISEGGDADATLWVEQDAKLDFPTFEARSLAQLRSLAGSARVVERVAAPTPEATIVRLAADAPEGSPRYEVTLRSSGPYRYYLATTVQPDAPSEAADGVDLIHGSFLPAGAKDAEGSSG